METIFDHNPTKAELDELVGNLSKEVYLRELESAPVGENLLFIALLYGLRGDQIVSSSYIEKVPDLYRQWQLGLDYVISPSV